MAIKPQRLPLAEVAQKVLQTGDELFSDLINLRDFVPRSGVQPGSEFAELIGKSLGSGNEMYKLAEKEIGSGKVAYEEFHKGAEVAKTMEAELKSLETAKGGGGSFIIPTLIAIVADGFISNARRNAVEATLSACQSAIAAAALGAVAGVLANLFPGTRPSPKPQPLPAPWPEPDLRRKHGEGKRYRRMQRSKT